MRLTGILFVLGFWSLIAFLAAANARLEHEGELGWILYELQNAYLWALLTPLVYWLSRRYDIGSLPMGRLVSLHAVAAVIVAVVKNSLDEVARDMLWIGRSASWDRVVEQQVSLDFYREFLIYGAILAASFAFNFYRKHQERRAEATRLQAQLVEAQLQALRMQLNPHFLFNTLNTISAMTRRDPKLARRLLARLSELLRRVLETTDEQEVPLAEEMTFLHGYLEIVKARMQGRLEVEVSVDEGLEGALVPSLILQPLVENAVEHGVARSAGLGRIEILANREGADLVLRVRDDGPGIGTVQRDRPGVGLRNTRARLQALYGDDAELRLMNGAGGGAVVEVRLRYRSTPVSAKPADKVVTAP